jgi:hypothetical protein
MSAAPAAGKAGRATGRKHSKGQVTATASEPSRLAQVRLRADEVETLQETMRVLHLDSTSDALREGLRLLARESAETAAAEQLHAHYGGQPAPLPDAVSAPSEDELQAADEYEW